MASAPDKFFVDSTCLQLHVKVVDCSSLVSIVYTTAVIVKHSTPETMQASLCVCAIAQALISFANVLTAKQ